MKIWIERALAALRLGREKLVALVKVVLAQLHVIFNTVYDPPPRTIRFWFWSAAAIVLVCWLTFAFVNSWFYRPTVQALAEFSYVLSGDDGDVDLPAIEPLQPAAAPAVELPAVEVVCHDMSDTPHCEPVKAEVSDIPPPVAKPKKTVVKKRLTTRRKHQPYVTYWGF